MNGSSGISLKVSSEVDQEIHPEVDLKIKDLKSNTVKWANRSVPVFVLYFLFDVGNIVAGYVALQILRQLLGRVLEVFLVFLEDDRLIRLLQIVGEAVGEHQRLSALAQHVDGLLEELHLDPAHVVRLHLLHLLLDRRVQFVLEAQRLHVVHVAVAIEQITL